MDGRMGFSIPLKLVQTERSSYFLIYSIICRSRPGPGLCIIYELSNIEVQINSSLPERLRDVWVNSEDRVFLRSHRTNVGPFEEPPPTTVTGRRQDSGWVLRFNYYKNNSVSPDGVGPGDFRYSGPPDSVSETNGQGSGLDDVVKG